MHGTGAIRARARAPRVRRACGVCWCGGVRMRSVDCVSVLAV